MTIAVDMEPSELEVLLDALEAWEREVGQSSLMSTIMAAVIMDDKNEVESITEKRAREAEIETRVRRRKAIILKAKLAAALDSVAADHLFSACK